MKDKYQKEVSEIEEIKETPEIIFQTELIAPEMVQVNAENLKQLVAQNHELKQDLGELITVFNSFSNLFSGKINMVTLPVTIMKLLKNDDVLNQFSHIQPILDKYKNA
ncbi:hypothetical protein I5M32_11300 [Pedobacter sp. SD-b]|uniref:Uncharacterized protein n=1 Tax=Pedobacter segetis TaxID=2793069 RepID=A0ABS1BL62_9SPHI|nr:hypothetical protein [Pedobacter segetis]MBK0383543.1 hypothetical protein [Pedobacter segetis]